MTAVSFCDTHRSVPLSAIFRKVFFFSRRFRDPKWTMYKEWETLEQSVLNVLSSSNTSHLGSDIYVGQEMERFWEPKVINEIKEKSSSRHNKTTNTWVCRDTTTWTQPVLVQTRWGLEEEVGLSALPLIKKPSATACKETLIFSNAVSLNLLTALQSRASAQ